MKYTQKIKKVIIISNYIAIIVMSFKKTQKISNKYV